MADSVKSHGNGIWDPSQLRHFGNNTVIEEDVLIFHPENIVIYDNIYVGHRTILKGYHKNIMEIGQGTWIGQNCFFHSAGGLRIGENVGIGIGVKIITSTHDLLPKNRPILWNKINFKKVIIEDDCDLGIGSIILPGVTVGRGAQVGAGSVVSKDVENYSIVAGVPARLITYR